MAGGEGRNHGRGKKGLGAKKVVERGRGRCDAFGENVDVWCEDVMCQKIEISKVDAQASRTEWEVSQ